MKLFFNYQKNCFKYNSQITKKPLRKLSVLKENQIIIGGILQHGEWNVATGDSHIRSEDRVIVVCVSLSLREVQKLFQ